MYSKPSNLEIPSNSSLRQLRDSKFREVDLEPGVIAEDDDFDQENSEQVQEEVQMPEGIDSSAQRDSDALEAEHIAKLNISNPTITDMVTGALEAMYPRGDDPRLRYGIPCLEKFYNDM